MKNRRNHFWVRKPKAKESEMKKVQMKWLWLVASYLLTAFSTYCATRAGDYIVDDPIPSASTKKLADSLDDGTGWVVTGSSKLSHPKASLILTSGWLLTDVKDDKSGEYLDLNIKDRRYLNKRFDDWKDRITQRDFKFTPPTKPVSMHDKLQLLTE